MKRVVVGAVVAVIAVLGFTALRGGSTSHRPVRSIDELAQRAGCSKRFVQAPTKPAVQSAVCLVKATTVAPIKLLMFSDSAGRDQVLNANAGHVVGLGANWLIVGGLSTNNDIAERYVTANIKKATHRAGGSVIP